MYIQVKLLSGFAKPLLYEIPHTVDRQTIQAGTIVHVPLKTRMVPAIVIKLFSTPITTAFPIKAIDHCYPFPADTYYLPFLHAIAYQYQIDYILLIKRLQHFLHNNTHQPPHSTATFFDPITVPHLLTAEQEAVTAFITPFIHTPTFKPTLVHGVTGSGKTEIYKQLIIEAVTHQKSVILLLPEVSLASAFEHRLGKELPPSIPLFGFHSGKNAAEKKLLWAALIDHKPVVIIGVHQPILLPIANLGLIIVDEEHDPGYQEKHHPKINSKEAAIMRAQHYNIPIILGSATPSLASLYRVKTAKWHFFQLKKRFSGTFPRIVIVPLRTNKNMRRCFWISNELKDAIQQRLVRKEQTIIFLNRRGHSFFVQCMACSFIFSCSHCSVSFTLHESDLLTCHYCARTMQLPSCCPSCTADKDSLIKKGIGTQQAVTILQNMFPTARIARADMDITRKKKQWPTLVEQFTRGEIDILVGTQTVTKGYHFPNVTLVGIIWADLNLHFPLFNASEITVQQLIQVAGRAGRVHNNNESLVIVQTMAEHQLFDHLYETSYLGIYQQEMPSRIALQYPPYQVLVEIEIRHANATTLEREALSLVSTLRLQCMHANDMQILGPSKPPIYRINNVETRMVYIKGPQLSNIVTAWRAINLKKYRCAFFFTPIF